MVIQRIVAVEMKNGLLRILIGALVALLIAPHGIHAASTGTETVTGLGIGLDVQSSGTNPVPSVGALWASFGVLSYQARATVSHRISDSTTFMRAGVGAGFIMFLLNFDLTAQTGAQNSTGVYWGFSAFLSGSSLTPEIFVGHQVNFAASVDNLVLAGFKGYLNFAELGPKS